MHGCAGAGDWWGQEFQIGRVPFDSKYCAVWRAFFESFAPAERVLAPVYRFPLRSRGARLRGGGVPSPGSLHKVAFDAVSKTRNLKASFVGT